jgi:glycosyltransferase involved in cell wall biosynthesis
MRIAVLSHDLSSNASMRAHRLASMARRFAEVELVGPVGKEGMWGALPEEGIRVLPKRRFPEFFRTFTEIVEAARGDVVVAVRPHLASFGAALVASELREIPVVLDVDDLDTALAPRRAWGGRPSVTDLARPGSAVYASLLMRAKAAAAATTASSSALAERFGGEVIPHGVDTDLFDPSRVDRDEARRTFGFSVPVVLFPGTPRRHKGIDVLWAAVSRIPGVRLAVTCRPSDLRGPQWDQVPPIRLPQVRYPDLPRLLAAADVVAIPQLDEEAARYQMPMKVFDAMAMGAPVVATSMSDLPSVLQGCGVIVPPGDTAALADAIASLVGDPVRAKALGRRARERCIDHYALDKVSEKLHAVVSRVAR